MSVSFTTRAPVSGRRGAIATSNFLATEAGMHMLREGGNGWTQSSPQRRY